MKPLLRVVLILNALVFLAFGLLFVLTPWVGLYGALQLEPIRVQPAFAGQLFGIALIGLAWLAFHAALDGALTARAARVSGHVQWVSGVVVLVWLLGLHMPEVAGFGQVCAAVVGAVLLVLGLGSVRLSSAVRRNERAKQAGAASAERAQRRASDKREKERDKERDKERVTAEPVDAGIRPAARAPHVTAVDPVTGRTVDTVAPAPTVSHVATRERIDGGVVDPDTGRTIDPATGREIDPSTGRRIEPSISAEIDPVTGRRIDPLSGKAVDPLSGKAVDPLNGAPR
jgi:hypothetical protein